MRSFDDHLAAAVLLGLVLGVVTGRGPETFEPVGVTARRTVAEIGDGRGAALFSLAKAARRFEFTRVPLSFARQGIVRIERALEM